MWPGAERLAGAAEPGIGIKPAFLGGRVEFVEVLADEFLFWLFTVELEAGWLPKMLLLELVELAEVVYLPVTALFMPILA